MKQIAKFFWKVRVRFFDVLNLFQNQCVLLSLNLIPTA